MGGRAGRQGPKSAMAKKLFSHVEKVMQHQQNVIAKLEAQLEAARSDLKETQDYLSQKYGGTNSKPAKPRKAGKTSDKKRTTKEEYEALRQRILKAMNPKKQYTGAEFMALAKHSVLEQSFVNNVRNVLLEAEQIKKESVNEGSRSPRDVRWVKA